MLFYDLFRHEPELFPIKAGDYLFREGDVGDVMYVLISGTAQIHVGGRVMEEVEPGGILGEMALVDHVPRSASVLATSDGGVHWTETHVDGAFDLNLAPDANGLFLGDYQALAAVGNAFVAFYARATTNDAANRTDIVSAYFP